MARKTVTLSDRSGEEIPEGTGATITVKFVDGRRGQRQLDVTDAEAEELGGRPIKARGRPKAAAASPEPAAAEATA